MLLRPFQITLLLTPALLAGEDKISFNKDIRTLFSNSCFLCHGPDAEERSADLRLDTFEGATAKNKDGVQAIVPGDPEASEAFMRIISKDPEVVMPPPKHGDAFTPEQAEIVRKWIEQGAEYETHWAYQKPERPAVPETKDAPEQWQQHPVDAFIHRQLAQKNLTPSPEADRRTLARRVALDLTGIPPTPQEVATFLSDESPDAYSKYVDRILAKPSYGEHWTRMWLDLARYADSAGYADDSPRTIWAYRDYVIRSFNENKPFDQFTVEQLAGDLMAKPTEEQLVATAFHRNTQTNNEGGTNDEEFRNVAVVDRTNTTMATWMGTTMACAQCHTHKYDPITHEEYFQMFDIFNQSEDRDLKDESPFLPLYTGQRLANKQKLKQRIALLEQQINNQKVVPAELAKWEQELKSNQTHWHPLPPENLRTQSGSTLTAQADHSILASDHTPETENAYIGTHLDPAQLPHITAVKIEALPDPSLPHNGPGRAGNGNFVLNDLSLTSTGSLKPRKPARYVRLELPGKKRILHFAEMQIFSEGVNVALNGTASQSSTEHGGVAQRAIDGNTDGNYPKGSVIHTANGSEQTWWEVDLGSEQHLDQIVIWNRTDGLFQERLSNFKLITLDENRNPVHDIHEKRQPKPSLSFNPDKLVHAAFDPTGATATYEQANFPATNIVDTDQGSTSGWAVAGQHGKANYAILPLLKPLPAGKLSFLLRQTYQKHGLGKFRISVTNDPNPKPAFTAQFLSALNTSAAQRSPQQAKLIHDYYLLNKPTFATQRQELTSAKQTLKQLKPDTTVPVMKERPDDKRRETHVHLRGSYLSHGPKVSAGFIKALSPEGFTPANKTPNRMDLAQWILHENNPLTARVSANRFWEKIFGIGIVATSEEFGSQGELPSHPDLLDWLAVEYRESGWDTKKFLKLLVTSATYKQSSHVTAELHAMDPANRLLARGPRVRLSAEMVRDQALAVAGLLSSKMYGHPVHPPQPDMGLNAAFGGAIDWKTSKGEDKYRRGLYTTWRRSNPYPSMATFDAPNREVCTIRRDRTNTPLQALVTLNDPVFIEAAQALARRLIREIPEASNPASAAEGSQGKRLSQAFELSLLRPPSENELERLKQLYDDCLQDYQADPAQAQEIATKPIGPAPQGVKLPELAAMTVVCNVILNLDELLMKR